MNEFLKSPRLLLMALCLALYLPGLFTLPPLDRDEARFVQSSKQMAASGDYVNIWFQDEPRHKKPVGIYWLQTASAQLFGADWIGSYRMVTLLGTLLAVLSLHYWLRRFGHDTGALWAAALLACCLGLTVEAHQAKTDAVLLACIITMQGVLLNVWRAPDRPALLPYLYWLALGAAVLIKGPVALLVGGLTVLALIAVDRSLALVWRMRPITGPLLSALVVAPWLYAIQSATSGDFLSGGYAQDVIPKLLGGVESHGAPPGYYLALLPVFFWPVSALLLPAIPVIWRLRREPLVVFALAWLVPAWIAIELIPTKLPHYVLPLYPALAILVAYSLMHGAFTARLALAGKLLWLLVGLVLCGAIIYAPIHLQMPVAWHAYLAALLGLAFMFAAWRKLRYALAFQLVILAYIFHILLPSLSPMWISQQLSEMLASRSDQPVAIAGYHEPSAVFLLGTQTQLTDAAGVASAMQDIGAIGIVDSRAGDALKAALGDTAAQLEIIGTVKGLNYAKGKWLELHLYQLTGAGRAGE